MLQFCPVQTSLNQHLVLLPDPSVYQLYLYLHFPLYKFNIAFCILDVSICIYQS